MKFHALLMTSLCLLVPGCATSFPLVNRGCRIELQIPAQVSDSRNETYRLTIHNDGSETVHLMQPGDGSFSGWRTPVIGWSILPLNSEERHPTTLPPDERGRCGNQNPYGPNEVFTLRPGQSQILIPWTGNPGHGLAPGKYRLVFYYENDPSIGFSGSSLSQHDLQTLVHSRYTTPLTLRSREVELELVDP